MNYNRLLSVFLILVIAFSACGGTTPPQQLPVASPTQVREAITIGKPLQKLPSSFLGFNIELSDVCTLITLDAANPGSYESLYTALGSGILHIGGHSADESSWSATGEYKCSANYSVVTPALAQALFTFARRIHWKVIWELPLFTHNPQNAASEAYSIARIGGKTLLSVALGNEPELYSKKFNGRPTSWNAEMYLSEWQTEMQAIEATGIYIPISGPDTCCNGPFFSTFIPTVSTLPEFTLLTHHYYTRSAVGPPATIAELLSPGTWSAFVTQLQGWMDVAHMIHRPFALTEVNSISNGGVKGISDTAAATIWLASVLLESVEQGISFVAIQEAVHAYYNVIEDDGRTSVLYSALQLVHRILATGSERLSIFGSIPQSLQLLAVQHSDGTLMIILINHQPHQVMNVSIDEPAGEKASTVTTLVAPALAATNHVQFVSRAWSGNMPVQIQPQSLVMLTYYQSRK